MSHRSIEQREADGMDAWQRIQQGAPEDCTWGFYAYSDAPPAMGGGIGIFAWFTDREQMLDFIQDTIPCCPPGRADLDWDEVAAHTASIVAEMKSGAIDDLQAIERLNSALVSFSHFCWIGTVTDLLTGSHAYARQVRAEFRHESLQDPASGAAIQADEQEEFCDFLTTWGA